MEQARMERVAEMELFLQDEKESLLKERIKKIKGIYAGSDIWKKKLETTLRELAVKDEKSCLIISYLRSSYITGSHNFYFAGFVGEPFVEEEPDSSYFCMQELLAETEEDKNTMVTKLRERFIRISPAEEEEIYRWYMDGLYRAMEDVFEEALKNIRIEGNKDVYYGGYMEELRLIGKI